jgi:hypothetical protein
LRDNEFFWLMIICVVGMWAIVAIIRTIVDGVVRIRQQKAELEREVLGEMMSELAEIKQRLDALNKTGTGV